MACLIAIVCYSSVARPLRFGLGLGAILIAASHAAALNDDMVLHQERTFFGVLKASRIRRGIGTNCYMAPRIMANKA